MDHLFSNNYDDYAQNYKLIKLGYGYEEIVQLIDGIKEQERPSMPPPPNYSYFAGL